MVEEHVAATAPLNAEGPSLVVSWDGVMVPVREPDATAWKEAGVGRVSVYGEPDEQDGRPPLLDSRCFARMPEAGMKTLIDEIVSCVATTRAQRPIERVAVICDGKDSIWKAAASCRELDGSVFILDFYHASQTLAGAANAIFGDGTPEARRWFERRRGQLLVDADALTKLLRALRRYQRILPAGSDAADVVRRAIAHFKKNRRRMRYPEFIAQGLPIGSGHVESAAKNLVAQRLKRSGMRWSCVGGQRVLNIRTRVKEDRWDVAWEAYTSARAAAWPCQKSNLHPRAPPSSTDSPESLLDRPAPGRIGTSRTRVSAWEQKDCDCRGCHSGSDHELLKPRHVQCAGAAAAAQVDAQPDSHGNRRHEREPQHQSERCAVTPAPPYKEGCGCYLDQAGYARERGQASGHQVWYLECPEQVKQGRKAET